MRLSRGRAAIALFGEKQHGHAERLLVRHASAGAGTPEYEELCAADSDEVPGSVPVDHDPRGDEAPSQPAAGDDAGPAGVRQERRQSVPVLGRTPTQRSIKESVRLVSAPKVLPWTRYRQEPSSTLATLCNDPDRRASQAGSQGPLEILPVEKREPSWYDCSVVIDPSSSSWLHWWDIISSIQLVAICFIWPYETAFLEPEFNAVFVLNRLCDMNLVIDMLMQFFIDYPDPLRPERSVNTARAIARNYVQGWFAADLISVLPVDYVYLKVKQMSHGDQSALWYLHTLQYIRVVRLIRLVRFVKLIERWNTSFGMSYTKITLLKLLSTLVLCCHWLACLWGGLVMKLNEETNWLDALRKAKDGPYFAHGDHFQVYSLSLYWAIVTITSIGYGDITPQSMIEYRVATLCSSIMAAIWAYVIGAICGIVATMDQHEAFFKRSMDDLNWFMEDQSMPPMMRQRLRRYFHEAKVINKQRVEKTVVTQLSPLLQGEVAMFMHLKWIKKVWYLRDMNHEIIVWAARNLTLAVFAPNEEVLGDRTLFILQRGICAYKGKFLTSGDIWGEDMLLSNACLREQSKARALSHLAVLTLHIADLFEVVVCFSEARARLRWAQMQIATCRGVLRLARIIKVMKAQASFDQWELTDEGRNALYREILQGSDHQDVFLFGGDADSGGQSPDALPRSATIGSHAVSMCSGPTEGAVVGAEVMAVLEQLQRSVDEIQKQLKYTSTVGRNSDHPIAKERSRSWALHQFECPPEKSNRNSPLERTRGSRSSRRSSDMK